jgi:hypothetical protein
MEELRGLLFDRYRGQINLLQTDLDHLRTSLNDVEGQINDQDALVTTIKPVIADAIGASIHESRDEMVDALYPIMGRLVSRAVAESIRDLAHSIDERMRSAFSFRAVVRRTRARASGVSGSAVFLRDAFPYSILQVFLIHREQGLLLAHASAQSQSSASRADSEIIGSMLTAIQDFARDAFGRGEMGSLNEVQYGDQVIIMEATTTAYLAAVVRGVAPPGLREQMRALLSEIVHTHRQALRSYDGNAEAFKDVEMQMAALVTASVAEPATARRQTPEAASSLHAADISSVSQTPVGRLPLSVVIVFILCVFTLVLFMWRVVALLTVS